MGSEPVATFPRRLELHLTSHPGQIAAVRRAVEAFCLHYGLEVAAAGEVGLCLNEALANVIRHAYRGADGQPILVVSEAVSDSDGSDQPIAVPPVTAIRVTVRDWGNGVNPSSLPPKPRDPLQPGGVGLICLTSMMDEVAFEPQADGMLLSMTKHPEMMAAIQEPAMAELNTGSDLLPSARKEADTVIASIRGEIDLHNSPDLRTTLLDLIVKQQPKKLVLNLNQVPYMDSSAIAVLVECLQKMRKTGGRIFLTNLQPRVKGLLEIAKLDSIFTISQDEAGALAK